MLPPDTIRSGDARIEVERDNSLLFLAAGAVVEVNGARIGTLGRGGATFRDVKAGETVVLSVRPTSAPGKFTVRFVPAAGRSYVFKVSPRGEALVLGSAFGLAGEAIAANISDMSGYFQIELVP